MTQKGVVLSVSGDSALVRIKRESACGHDCSSCGGGCGGGFRVVKVKNSAGAKKDDKVILFAPGKRVLAAAFSLYILPLLFLIGGYFIASVFTDKVSILTSVASVMFLAACIIIGFFHNKLNFETKITEIED